MKDIRLTMDGTTWMVSVLHPDCVDVDGRGIGSSWYSERAGATPIEAAVGYMSDGPSENEGVAKVLENPSLAFLCVVGQEVAPGKRQWKVYLFVVEDGKVKAFP